MGAALVIVFWLAYHKTATWFFSSDSLCYMLDVEFGGPRNIFHPFHMAYSALGRGILLAAQFAGYQDRAIFIMQAANAILGAVAMGVFYRIVRARFGLWPSAVITLALGFSYAFWSEIVDPGCYALAALATCLLLALLMRDPKESPLLTGMSHGLAILVHFMLVLTIPAFLWSIYRAIGPSRKEIVRYLVGVTLVVGLAYGAMVIHLGSFREFVSWFLEPAWKPQSQFLSQNYLHWNLFENARLSGAAFRDSVVRIAPASPAWEFALATVIVGISLAAVVAGSVWIYSRAEKADHVVCLWLWILGLSSLQFVYASDTRFRVLWLPAFFLLILEIGRMPFFRGWGKWLGLFVPLLIWVNYEGTLKPQTMPEANPSFRRTIWVTRHLTAKDFLLFRGAEPESIRNFYAAYFAHEVPARSLQGLYFSHPNEGLKVLDVLLKEQTSLGRRLVFENSFWDPQEQQQIADLSHVSVGEVSRWMSRWRPVARLIAPDGYTLVAVARQAK